MSMNSTLQRGIQGRQEFLSFWEKCKSQVATDEHKSRELDDQLANFCHQSDQLHSTFSQYRELIHRIPVAVAVGDWVRGLCLNHSREDKHFSNMVRLQQHQLIPYKDPHGEPIRLEYFIQHGHQDVLENVRCIQQWSVSEKEGVVQSYLQFSKDLSLKTCGLIPEGFDPDQERARHKAVKYEMFLDFVQQLPVRDALIAKLLYFGAPSIEGVLALKRDAVVKNALTVYFDEGYVVYAKHIIQDLFGFITEKEGEDANEPASSVVFAEFPFKADEGEFSICQARGRDQPLIFTNFKGAEVERAHLNQSFTRACERLPVGTKITPGGLLKFESDFWHCQKFR